MPERPRDVHHLDVRDNTVYVADHEGQASAYLYSDRGAFTLDINRKSDDAEIARRAVNSLEWDISVPTDKVKVEVEKGLLTLTGEVDWQYQRLSAESAVRKLSGVTGITNLIKVKPHASAYEVRQKIKAALDRNSQIEANGISITTDGGKVTLSGKVHTWFERNLAERTAWSAPGVTLVDDRLTVG